MLLCLNENLQITVQSASQPCPCYVFLQVAAACLNEARRVKDLDSFLQNLRHVWNNSPKNKTHDELTELHSSYGTRSNVVSDT